MNPADTTTTLIRLSDGCNENAYSLQIDTRQDKDVKAQVDQLDIEGTDSQAPDLNNDHYKAIQDEAECDLTTECFSDLNRAVSEILKNRQSDPNDIMSKKHRQRLTYEQ